MAHAGMLAAARASHAGLSALACFSLHASVAKFMHADASCTPPRLALCVAGAARGFTSPLVLDALRRNLLEPLAGRSPAATGTRLFLSLKIADSAKRAGGVAFHQHRIGVESIRDALSELHELVGEAMIVNGSGAYDPSRWRDHGDGTEANVVAADPTLWRSYTASHCKRSGYLDAGNNEERLVHQHLGLAWCRGAILRSEATTRTRFDVVAFTRPDLVWWTPLPTWCNVSAQWRSSMWSCDSPGCDMSWVAPRTYMERLMGQAEMHRDCNEPHSAWHGKVRNVRSVASCCSTSEWLLWYAQSARAQSSLIRLGADSFSPAGNASTAGGYGEIPVTRLRAFEPDRGSFSLLREASGACELALSDGYGQKKERLRLQQWHGLSVATGERLRARFGPEPDNLTACRRMLLRSSQLQLVALTAVTSGRRHAAHRVDVTLPSKTARGAALGVKNSSQPVARAKHTPLDLWGLDAVGLTMMRSALDNAWTAASWRPQAEG